MTKKLYWDEPKLLQFQSVVTAIGSENGKQIISLDRTAFYPTGGGQPCDVGSIESSQVTDVVIAADGEIYHQLETPLALRPGAVVSCSIDHLRRHELTQQHTGQHILSQSFFRLFGAETKGFRIDSQSSEIDLALDAPSDSLTSWLQKAEDLANQIVFENRPIRTHLVSPDEAEKFPLRRESFVADCVRIVEIDQFDWSACGGTHAEQTGEVGLIVIKKWERAKKMLRVEFLCGIRSLHDYRMANQTSLSISRQFSVARDDSPSSVSRLVQENKDLKHRIRTLSEIIVKHEATEMLSLTAQAKNVKVVCKTFSDRSFDEAKLLAHQLVATESVVALFAVEEKGMTRLVFARSANVTADMGNWMREACQMIEGKGGGGSDFAQGGGRGLEKIPSVFQMLCDRLS